MGQSEEQRPLSLWVYKETSEGQGAGGWENSSWGRPVCPHTLTHSRNGPETR